MVPDMTPKSLLVVGSGAIGIEFASFYHSLGIDVTVVEILPRILPVEDEDISKLAGKLMAKRGLEFKLATKVAEARKSKDSVTCVLEGPEGGARRDHGRPGDFCRRRGRQRGRHRLRHHGRQDGPGLHRRRFLGGH